MKFYSIELPSVKQTLALLILNHIFADTIKQQGNWEFDLKSHKLFWDDKQYDIYGFSPGEISINDEYFLVNTTHSSDLKRTKTIIDEALKNYNAYNFKRRIIKRDGAIGFAETQAKIIRSHCGKAERIIGKTIDLDSFFDKDSCDFNDPRFFDLLYKNYKRAVYNEIFKMVHDNCQAKDLCQEVFLKVWTNMNFYDPQKGAIYTWLINIAKNHCKDHLRSRYFRDQKNTENLDFIKKGSTDEYNAEKAFVKQLISFLPSARIELMELLFIQGFTQAEVSSMMGIPLGTVKTRSRDAIITLRHLLNASKRLF